MPRFQAPFMPAQGKRFASFNRARAYIECSHIEGAMRTPCTLTRLDETEIENLFYDEMLSGHGNMPRYLKANCLTHARTHNAYAIYDDWTFPIGYIVFEYETGMAHAIRDGNW